MNFLDMAIAETKQESAATVEVVSAPRLESDGLFNVESAPVSGPYGTIQGKKGLFVGRKNINIVSSNYEVVQPREVARTFADIAEKTGLKVTVQKGNPHNGGLLLAAKFQTQEIRGESHDINVTFYTAHDGRYKTFLTLDALRIACFNQVPVLYRNNKRHIFAEKHYRNALNLDTMGEIIENIPASIAAYAEKAEILEENKLSMSDFLDMWVAHNKLTPTQKQFDSKIAKMRAIYQNGQGQKGLAETAYKAYQAITFANTHDVKDSTFSLENIITRKSDDSLKWLATLLEQEPVENELVYLDAE